MKYSTNQQSGYECNECRCLEELLAAKDNEITKLSAELNFIKGEFAEREEIIEGQAIEIERLKQMLRKIIEEAEPGLHPSVFGGYAVTHTCASTLATIAKEALKGDSK